MCHPEVTVPSVLLSECCGFKELNSNASNSRHPPALAMKIYILPKLPALMYKWHHTLYYLVIPNKNTARHKHLWCLKIITWDRQACAYVTNTSCIMSESVTFLFSPTCPIFPSSCSFIGSKMGAGPSITSNISVSNLMRRCEWILKQAGEAPGEACAGPPGPAAGLNKYTAEQICRQLGPNMAAAVCVVALQGRWGESSETLVCFLGEEKGEKIWTITRRRSSSSVADSEYGGPHHRHTTAINLFTLTPSVHLFACYFWKIKITT